jgi:hypothetical protein
VFRFPDGQEIARASKLREMEKILPSIPDESVFYHGRRNHFSSWYMLRLILKRPKPMPAVPFTAWKTKKWRLRFSS